MPGERQETEGHSTESRALDLRVLILAPTGNDARLTAEFLEKNGLTPEACPNMDRLCDEIPRGCGAIILAEEVLGEKSILGLVEKIAAQPAWSDVPVILITSGGEVGQTRLRRLHILGPAGNVTVLERPFRPATLISTVEVALRTRRRQYEARDLLEALKRAHNEVQAASRAKDDFLAALSHELRTPLNPALLIASDAAEDYTLPEAVRSNFEIIRKNIELEARLIDDLLDLTRITRGKLALYLAPAQVGRLIEDAIETCSDDLKAKGLSLVREIDHSEIKINVDGARITQILWNLLKNAAKFTPARGRIIIRTRLVRTDGSERLAIEVSDTGVGINAAHLDRIFMAFEQGDSNVTRQFGGLGLGLAISKAIAEFHNGFLTAASEGEGRGSTFTLTLPLEISDGAGDHWETTLNENRPQKMVSASPAGGRALRILSADGAGHAGATHQPGNHSGRGEASEYRPAA